jgi:uncharacterized protein YoaH (UPF0181 family)
MTETAHFVLHGVGDEEVDSLVSQGVAEGDAIELVRAKRKRLINSVTESIKSIDENFKAQAYSIAMHRGTHERGGPSE